MIRVLGNLLIVVGLAGFALVVAMPRLPAPVAEPLAAVVEPVVAVVVGEEPTAQTPSAAEIVARSGGAPITRLVIPSIELDTAVVPAPLVEHDGVSTWAVPRFVAGHAEGSAGAGEPGNAILIGHVTSLTLGHVFESLDHVVPGDPVTVFSSATEFRYRVDTVGSVARDDLEPLDSTSSASLTLITCSGAWLPSVHDYAQRLVVRSELIQ